MTHKYYFFCIVTLILIMTTGCSALQTMGISAPSGTATPLPTNTVIPVPTETATPTPTETVMPSPTPTAIGGGSGKFVFSGWVRSDDPSVYSIPNVYLHDFSINETILVLKNYRLQDLSPEGDKLLISQGQNLFLANVDGSNVINLREDFYSSVFSVAGWLRGSNLIAFTKEVNGIVQLFSQNPQGEIQQLTYSTIGVLDFYPKLLENRLFWEEGYADDRGIYHNGWTITNLNTNEKINKYYSDLEISLDGMHIAYSDRDSMTINETLVISDVKGTILTQFLMDDLVEDTSSQATYLIENFFWLADGQHVFVFINRCDTNCKLYSTAFVLSITGELIDEYEIKNNDIRVPETLSWSPDKSQLLFSCLFLDEDNEWRRAYFRIFDDGRIEEIELIDLKNLNIFTVDRGFWIP